MDDDRFDARRNQTLIGVVELHAEPLDDPPDLHQRSARGRALQRNGRGFGQVRASLDQQPAPRGIDDLHSVFRVAGVDHHDGSGLERGNSDAVLRISVDGETVQEAASGDHGR